MKHFIFAAVLLSSCAHINTPAAFGFSGRQCQAVRSVVCVPDVDMSLEWCTAHVPQAIKLINAAIGHQMLRFDGAIAPNESDVLKRAEDGTIVLWAEKIDALGLTSYTFVKGTDCLGTVIVRLNPELVSGQYEQYADLVVIHELCHTIGAAHTDQGIYRSIMTRAPNLDNSSAHLTQYDIAALQNMYN